METSNTLGYVNEHKWEPGPGNNTFLEVASTVVTWWMVAFMRSTIHWSISHICISPITTKKQTAPKEQKNKEQCNPTKKQCNSKQNQCNPNKKQWTPNKSYTTWRRTSINLLLTELLVLAIAAPARGSRGGINLSMDTFWFLSLGLSLLSVTGWKVNS